MSASPVSAYGLMSMYRKISTNLSENFQMMFGGG